MSTRSGRHGERSVELWLAEHGWVCRERNMRIPGGEIDRLFVRKPMRATSTVDVCVAEIKTTHIKTARQISALLGEAKLRALIRPHQIRNLWRTAAHYESRLRLQSHKSQVRTYVRYFLVLKAEARVLRALKSRAESGNPFYPMRLCRMSDSDVILSWSPDVPTQT